MALKQIIDAIRTKMQAIDPAGTPPFEVGAKHLHTDRHEPVVIWVPQGERIGGPEGQGGDGRGRDKPRPLFTRHVTVVAHLWEENLDKVEALINLVGQAVWALGWGATFARSAMWQTGASIVTSWGLIYGLSFEWKIPITDVVPTTAVITAMPITGEIDLTL